ncbi:hypothetical protein [Novosphingobium sp.]
MAKFDRDEPVIWLRKGGEAAGSRIKSVATFGAWVAREAARVAA